MKAFLKSQRGLLLALCLLAAAAVFAGVQLNALPKSFQRVFLPAEQKTAGGEDAAGGSAGDSAEERPNQYLRDMMDQRKTADTALVGSCEPTTLYAVAQPATIVNDKQARSADARLVGIDESYLSLQPLSLFGGRYFYPDEYLRGQRVTLIDEQLAVELFGYAEPLLEHISLGGASYRIIGVVRDHKRVGDQMEYSLYVPYRSLIAAKVDMTALVYEARPVAGAGGWAAFSSAADALGARGTTISLVKESMNAQMPIRLLLVAVGGALALFGVGVLNRLFQRLARDFKRRLRDRYARELMGWLLLRAVGLALGYAACGVALAQLFMTLLAPVFTFPEWVPAILVEPRDIAAAFWNVWQKPAAVVELRTPELLRARFFGTVTAWVCGGAAYLLGVLWGRARERLIGRFSWLGSRERPEEDEPGAAE